MQKPPPRTGERIRFRAVWAVLFLAVSVAPGIVSTGLIAGSDDWTGGAIAIFVGAASFGVLFALCAAFPTLRYWEVLPNLVRWLGALPLIAVLVFAVATAVATL
jgi:hypothetical protein